MLAWLKRSLSMMPPKAYRWIAEMHEIADFVSEDPAGHELYVGAAHFYEQIARDFDGDKKEVAALHGVPQQGREQIGADARHSRSCRNRDSRGATKPG